MTYPTHTVTTRKPFALRTAALAAALTVSLASTPLALADDLIEVYEAARNFDPVYQAALKQYDAALQRLPQARAGLLPTVGLSASATRSESDSRINTPVGTVRSEADNTATQGALSATQPLFRPQTWAGVDQAKITEQIAEAQKRIAEQELITRVAKAYFDVLAAQDSLAFTRAQKQAVGEQLAAARRNFEVGTSTITDSREAQARFDLVTAQEIAAESDLQVKRNSLQQIAGRVPATLKPLAVNPVIPGPLPDSMDEWLSRADRGNLSVAQAQLNEEISKLETTKARRGHLPTLDLTASSAVRRDSAGSSTGLPVRTQSNSIGLNFTMPLYAGGAIQARVKETLALEEKAALDTQAARTSVSQGTRTAFLGVKSGLAQVKALEAAELSSQSALDANRLGYQVGVRINIDVLNSQSQLFQTKRDLARARYDVINNGLQLKALTGALNRDDLAQVNALLADPPASSSTGSAPAAAGQAATAPPQGANAVRPGAASQSAQPTAQPAQATEVKKAGAKRKTSPRAKPKQKSPPPKQ
jgi:outer membrane protein